MCWKRVVVWVNSSFVPVESFSFLVCFFVMLFATDELFSCWLCMCECECVLEYLVILYKPVFYHLYHSLLFVFFLFFFSYLFFVDFRLLFLSFIFAIYLEGKNTPKKLCSGDDEVDNYGAN